MSNRLFVERDADGALCVWENLPDRPSAPRFVLHLRFVKDDALRDAIVELVEGGGVE